MSDTLSPGSPEPETRERTARDAPPPFDHAHADLVLRSSDGMRFRVFKPILSLASPVFSDMLDLGAPLEGTPAASDEKCGELPMVTLSEDARTLDLLLRWCYPVKAQKLSPLEDVRRLVAVAQKYGIEAFDDVLDDALQAHFKSDPVGVFAIAVAYNLEEIAKTAARSALRIPLRRIVSSRFAGLAGGALNVLVEYHLECGEAASAVASRRDYFTVVDNLIGLHSPPCSSCCCLDVGIPVDDNSWYAPRLLWRYLDKAGRSLLLRPHEETIRSKSPISTCNGCTRYSVQRAEGMKQFEHRFVREVNAAITQVPVPSFV
ncbi:hypothetical protein FA95DRAFT_1606948 [Auriscalpium vulgare]|uniref:Uncharacterized protein n=1 Tax=Auriscalpium vulgare TaxID=40419 RepID=A0ACB8RQ35_9AGAM|nr:hypothetical protein FA95DRAFT_1606948 [Auriscalpium vulgare]